MSRARGRRGRSGEQQQGVVCGGAGRGAAAPRLLVLLIGFGASHPDINSILNHVAIPEEAEERGKQKERQRQGRRRAGG